jgi:transglutaminase-like putative cysteine protease
MILTIDHRTTYTYTDRVFLEPQTIRLVPRSDAMQHCHTFSLNVIAPTPAGQARIIDLDGNPAVAIWFDRLTDRFEIITRSVVETLCTNPFNFLLSLSEEVPFDYPYEANFLLQPNLQHDTVSNPVRLMAKHLADSTNHEIIPFLAALTSWIFQNIEQVVRDEGEPFTSEKTLQSKVGSCRDTAVLFMDACRTLGLATRFVSGYVLHTGAAETERHLHAWAEVFLPGAGWKGFDPSRGLAVSDAHIAVAAGYTPGLAAPVSGSFRGKEASSQLSFSISLNEFFSLDAALAAHEGQSPEQQFQFQSQQQSQSQFQGQSQMQSF